MVTGAAIAAVALGFAIIHRQHSRKFDAATAFYGFFFTMGLAYTADEWSSAATSLLIGLAFALLVAKGGISGYQYAQRRRTDS